MKKILTSLDVLESDITYIKEALKEVLGELSGANILFTGGAGFLGYMFLHFLHSIGRADGYDPPHITVLENFSRGRKPWLEELSKSLNINLIEHDISKPLPLFNNNFNYIIHAASIASPIFYREHPVATIDANVNGIRYLLDYSLDVINQKYLKGLLFFSTSEIYGDPEPTSIPTPETYKGNVSCTGPRACYDESKRLGETLCVNYARHSNVPVKIVRPFNNYGPGLDINDGRLMPDMARSIFNGEDLVLHSDGAATRTFCYISDAIVGYVKVLLKGKAGDSYNIGSDGPELSVANFARLVAKESELLFAYKGKVTHKPSADSDYLVDNPQRRCPDLSKARIELGYHPTVSLEAGIRKSMIWYEGNKR